MATLPSISLAVRHDGASSSSSSSSSPGGNVSLDLSDLSAHSSPQTHGLHHHVRFPIAGASSASGGNGSGTHHSLAWPATGGSGGSSHGGMSGTIGNGMGMGMGIGIGSSHHHVRNSLSLPAPQSPPSGGLHAAGNSSSSDNSGDHSNSPPGSSGNGGGQGGSSGSGNGHHGGAGHHPGHHGHQGSHGGGNGGRAWSPSLESQSQVSQAAMRYSQSRAIQHDRPPHHLYSASPAVTRPLPPSSHMIDHSSFHALDALRSQSPSTGNTPPGALLLATGSGEQSPPERTNSSSTMGLMNSGLSSPIRIASPPPLLNDGHGDAPPAAAATVPANVSNTALAVMATPAISATNSPRINDGVVGATSTTQHAPTRVTHVTDLPAPPASSPSTIAVTIPPLPLPLPSQPIHAQEQQPLGVPLPSSSFDNIPATATASSHVTITVTSSATTTAPATTHQLSPIVISPPPPMSSLPSSSFNTTATSHTNPNPNMIHTSRVDVQSSSTPPTMIPVSSSSLPLPSPLLSSSSATSPILSPIIHRHGHGHHAASPSHDLLRVSPSPPVAGSNANTVARRTFGPLMSSSIAVSPPFGSVGNSAMDTSVGSTLVTGVSHAALSSWQTVSPISPSPHPPIAWRATDGTQPQHQQQPGLTTHTTSGHGTTISPRDTTTTTVTTSGGTNATGVAAKSTKPPSNATASSVDHTVAGIAAAAAVTTTLQTPSQKERTLDGNTSTNPLLTSSSPSSAFHHVDRTQRGSPHSSQRGARANGGFCQRFAYLCLCVWTCNRCRCCGRARHRTTVAPTPTSTLQPL